MRTRSVIARIGGIPSDYAALIGATTTQMVFLAGFLAGCDCRLCEPTGYVRFEQPWDFVHGERPAEFGAGLRCNIEDCDGRR